LLTVFHTAELSTNSLGDLWRFWNYDFHTFPFTAELSTNSLRDFEVFWKSDFQTVFHTTVPTDVWSALVFIFI
jgi:hypothetical protein